MQRYACLDLNKLGLDYGGIQKDEDRLALKRQKNREKKRRSRARKAIAKQEAKALAADAEMVKKEEEVKEANVDNICIGGLSIGKSELDTNEPSSNLKSPPEALTVSSALSLSAQQQADERLAIKRQKAKERKRRSRAKNKSEEKTALESAQRKERRDRRPPEKKAEDNANRRINWANKKEDANANRRQKYQSSNLRAVNEKRRLAYLQMTSEEKSIVKKKGAERFRAHRTKIIGPSVECAEYGCKSLVPLLRDERYCYRHRGYQRIKIGWNGEAVEAVYKNRSGLDAKISLQALIEKFGDLHQCEGPNCKLKTNLGPCLKSTHINSGGRRVPKSFEESKFCFPKFCTDCEPEIDVHDNQPLELKCSSLEMYSTVIESFVISKDTLPIEVQELVESECLFYCFMGYCTSDCKLKDKHKTVDRYYSPNLGHRFKRLLQFRDAARRSYDSTMSESANFAWNDFAKCHFCSEECHLRDLIGQAEYPSPLSCRTCLLRHAQNTFDYRRKSLSIQDGSYIKWPYKTSISIQAYVERLALSFKSPKPLDIASQAYNGYLYDDRELKSFLGIQEVDTSQYKEEQKRREMAAISIQKTFRCFRIKWRYEVYVSQFVDGIEMNDDGEAIPKPPLNGYFMYSAFILPKIKEENPNATLTEMMTLISVAYKALDKSTRLQYKDEASKEMAKYKAKQFDPKSSITRDEASRVLQPPRGLLVRSPYQTSLVTIKTAAKGVYVSWAVRPDGDIHESLFAFAYGFKENYENMLFLPDSDWYSDRLLTDDKLELHKRIIDNSCSAAVDYEYDLVEDWKVAGFVTRKNPIMGHQPLRSFNKRARTHGECLAMITILKEDEIEKETAESIGTHIASVFNKACRWRIQSRETDHFTYRNVVAPDQAELLPLSHYLLDCDLVRVFLTMYDTEENEAVDLLQQDDLLRSFFGTAERGRSVLRRRYLHSSPTASSSATVPMEVDRPVRYAYQDQVIMDALADATDQIDVVQTAVPNVFVSWSTKLNSMHSLSPSRRRGCHRDDGTPSNLTRLKSHFDSYAQDNDLMAKWGIQGFMYRRIYDDLNPNKMSNSKLQSNGLVWYAMVTITREESTPNKVGTFIAKALTDFTNKKYSLQSKKREYQYVFRNNATDDKPSPLSKYLTDYGVVGVLMSMYGSNGKKEIMKCDELLVAFFGDADRGRRMLKYVDFGDTAQKSQSILDDYGYTATTTNDEEQMTYSSTTTPQASADQDVNTKMTIDNLQISHTQSVIRHKRYVTDESSVGEESCSDDDTYGDDTELALDQLGELGFDLNEQNE